MTRHDMKCHLGLQIFLSEYIVSNGTLYIGKSINLIIGRQDINLGKENITKEVFLYVISEVIPEFA